MRHLNLLITNEYDVYELCEVGKGEFGRECGLWERTLNALDIDESFRNWKMTRGDSVQCSSGP